MGELGKHSVWRRLLTAGLLLATVLLISVCAHAVTGDSVARPHAGELCVEGRLDGPLDSGGAAFSVRATAVEMADGARYWLPAITAKQITITTSTQYIINGESSLDVYYRDDGHKFFHIRACGVDHGKGKPLDARLVSLTTETDAQSELFDHLAIQTQPADGQDDHLRPMVSAQTETIQANGQAFNVAVVSAKLSTVSIRCGIAKDRVGATETLGSIANRYNAIAAINGSFFDAYDSGPTKMPDMPLISHGNLLEYSTIGTLLGFTDDGRWRMEKSADVVRWCGANCCRNPNDDDEAFLFWSHVTEAVGCGPRLVVDGVPKLQPYDEGISSGEVLNPHTVRSAVGITADGRILFVVANRAGLGDMAHIMVSLGAQQAMNMDGGSSSGLWCRGKNMVAPGRELSNALLITSR